MTAITMTVEHYERVKEFNVAVCEMFHTSAPSCRSTQGFCNFHQIITQIHITSYFHLILFPSLCLEMWIPLTACSCNLFLSQYDADGRDDAPRARSAPHDARNAPR